MPGRRYAFSALFSPICLPLFWVGGLRLSCVECVAATAARASRSCVCESAHMCSACVVFGKWQQKPNDERMIKVKLKATPSPTSPPLHGQGRANMGATEKQCAVSEKKSFRSPIAAARTFTAVLYSRYFRMKSIAAPSSSFIFIWC